MKKGARVQDEAPPESNHRYFIDMKWYEESGRSFQQMLDSRMPGAAPHEDKPKGKRKKAPEINKVDVTKIEGFITPSLPIKEAVFRLLLVNNNQPMDVAQISKELVAKGLGGAGLRDLSPAALDRILSTNQYYGLKRIEEPEEKDPETAAA